MPGKKVLLIDDDESLRRVVEVFLQDFGIHVTSAPTGARGLELFAHDPVPLVITDIQMEGTSGLDVLKQIKVEFPNTLVIIITAFGTVETAVKAMKLGAFDYLTKPFSRDQLKIAVEKAFTFLELQEENSLLRARLSVESFPSIIAYSTQMRSVIAMARRVAASEATVLLLGESGTGKEVVARAIHQASERKRGAFVAVNCAAIPGELLESELFGHLRGAFTGAVNDRKGKFELAEGGTILLDEVGELPMELQPKLLRVLQEREMEPVGGRLRKVNVRVIAATNRELEDSIAQGRFREDLYYRLAVIPIHLPPLRTRREDIAPLVEFFLKKHKNGTEMKVSEQAMRCLVGYDWPGNVRELENAVERMLVLARSEQVEEWELPARIRSNQKVASRRVLSLPEGGYSLETLEKEAIVEALLRNNWNQTQAANFLRVPRHVLAYRVEKYGIRKL